MFMKPSVASECVRYDAEDSRAHEVVTQAPAQQLEQGVRRWPRTLVAGGVLTASLSLGCNAVLGYESEYVLGTDASAAEDSSGGTGGKGGAGGDASTDVDADATAECDGGAQPIGMLGDPCCNAAELACGGHAQKLVLICDPKSHLWAALQSCSGKQLCDSEAGVNQGSCQDPIAICVGKNPGDKLCDGLIAVQCGADLVTSIDTPCENACKDGECLGACKPGERHCAERTPEFCDERGSWQSEAPCPYVCVGDGQCTGSCMPGSEQCNSNVPQKCESTGEWSSGAACEGATPVCSEGTCVSACTDGLKQCSNKVLQGCAGGVWHDELDCQYLCSGGECIGSCKPGSKQCDGKVPQTCDSGGVLQNGTECPFVCAAGSCSGECLPGSKDCSGLTPRNCSITGQWQADPPCAYVCSGGVCSGVCTPGDTKCNGQVTQSCSASGQWVDGSTCQFVCTAGTCGGACAPGTTQCNGLEPQTCNGQGGWDTAAACAYVCSDGSCSGECVPGTKDCAGLTPRTCDANGTWQSGSACQDKACISGVCQGVCAPGAKQCNGNLVQTCQGTGQWDAGTPCSGGTPVCGGGQCVPTTTSGPSCTGLAEACGPAANENCCASTVVPGGLYYRMCSPSFPATISDFRMDPFEVTVGRFRKFVAAYSQSMTPSGAGKNPNNPADTGWNTAWNTYLPANAAALTGTSGVQCDSKYQTWTSSPGVNENRPINCVSWYEAYAFCIWDGGRLPTEAEWEYVAAAGDQCTDYPWGSTPVPGNNANLAIYGCYYQANGNCTGVANIAPVGSVGAGKGYWGQSDLAGNVYEWTQDWYSNGYTSSCDNCAKLADPGLGLRVVRGGCFNSSADPLHGAYQMNGTPTAHSIRFGIRCVRPL